jgi:hypothetical protein
MQCRFVVYGPNKKEKNDNVIYEFLAPCVAQSESNWGYPEYYKVITSFVKQNKN